MITPGKYSATSLRELLKITERMWRDRRPELLEHLSKYFDYEMKTEGRYIYFYIKEQYGEYQPLLAKKNIEKMTKYYESEIERLVQIEPYNTSANMSRNVIADNKNIYNHVEGTISRYMRPIVKEKYTPPIQEKAWMRLDESRLHYIPLTEEQLDFLQGLFKDNSREARTSRQIELFAEYRSGYITEIELKSKLFDDVGATYESLMSQFKKQFGFRPQLVKKLEKCAWNDSQEQVEGQE